METPPPPLRESGRAVVVGGGIAGATAARALQKRGLLVTVLDKGRGVGGRLSTRRSDAGAFDHGAQCFTARSLPFVDAVGEWAQAEAARRWVGRFAELDGDGLRVLPDRNLWVGIPGMSRIVAHQLDGLDIRFGSEARGVVRSAQGWSVETASGDRLGPFEHAVVAVPAPQAAVLLGAAAPTLAESARAVRFAPCWSVMAAFASTLSLPFDGLSVLSGSPLERVSRDGSKPARDAGPPERWVLHAGPDWSRANIDLEPEEAGELLVRAFLGLVTDLRGAASAPSYVCAHSWRYARPLESLETPCLHDPAISLAVCGDWCLGPRVEDAWTSGVAAASALLGSDAG
ncbi:MAG: NAD(P)/FAD-dependent oxidoreductase [Phycisphaerales bacterium JB041]